MEHHRNYCTECSWSASTEEHSRYDVSSLAIEHFTETGHTIDSEAVAERGQRERTQHTDYR